MALYATIQEIKDNCSNVANIANGSDAKIRMWGSEAAVRINMFCHQNFAFEQQVTKRIATSYYPTVILPKPISGQLSVSQTPAGGLPTQVGVQDIEWEPYATTFRYLPRNVSMPQTSSLGLAITADWGYVDSQDTLVALAAKNLRARYESHRVSTVYHVISDTVNEILSPAPTTLDAALLVLNELRADYNAHVVNTSVHLVAGNDLVTAPIATDLETAIALAEDIKRKYNNHLVDTAAHKAVDTNRVTVSLDNLVMPEEIKIAFYKITSRIAIRDNPDDLRYHNSGFASESWSDGYSYNLSNAELRALIHPNDVVLLWEHINHGRVVS